MSRTIELTQGLSTIVDDRDYDRIAKGPKWRAFKTEFGTTFYAIRTIRKPDGRKTSQLLHRLILRSRKRKVDHKDTDGLNNQRENLRRCTQSQNRMNSRKTAGHSSKYKGVSWDKENHKWIAAIKINGKRIHLGRFADEILAAKAYDAAAQKYFKTFARLNFPEAT